MTVSCADPLRPELLWFLMEESKLSHLSLIDLFGCCRNTDYVLLLHTNWGMSSVMQFCSLGGFCQCMYMHIQVRIKNCGQMHFYAFCMHMSFFMQSRTHTLTLCHSHQGYQGSNWGRVIPDTDWLPMQKSKALLVQCRIGRGNEGPNRKNAYLSCDFASQKMPHQQF